MTKQENNQKLNLAILMACHHSPDVEKQLMPVGDMFLNLLTPAMSGWNLEVFDVVDQRYPDNFNRFDAVVITGSPASVYDDIEWVRTLHKRVKEVVKDKIPIVGVCFGHQLLGEILGGKVEKAAQGWGLGLKPVKFASREWMSPTYDQLNLSHVHQDQVIDLPPKAERIAGDSFCPNAAFELDGRFMGIQGHPEFSNETLKVLSYEMKSRGAPDHLVENSLTSLEARNDGSIFAQWIAHFLRRAVERRGASG